MTSKVEKKYYSLDKDVTKKRKKYTDSDSSDESDEKYKRNDKKDLSSSKRKKKVSKEKSSKSKRHKSKKKVSSSESSSEESTDEQPQTKLPAGDEWLIEGLDKSKDIVKIRETTDQRNESTEDENKSSEIKHLNQSSDSLKNDYGESSREKNRRKHKESSFKEKEKYKSKKKDKSDEDKYDYNSTAQAEKHHHKETNEPKCLEETSEKKDLHKSKHNENQDENKTKHKVRKEDKDSYTKKKKDNESKQKHDLSSSEDYRHDTNRYHTKNRDEQDRSKCLERSYDEDKNKKKRKNSKSDNSSSEKEDNVTSKRHSKSSQRMNDSSDNYHSENKSSYKSKKRNVRKVSKEKEILKKSNYDSDKDSSYKSKKKINKKDSKEKEEFIKTYSDSECISGDSDATTSKNKDDQNKSHKKKKKEKVNSSKSKRKDKSSEEESNDRSTNQSRKDIRKSRVDQVSNEDVSHSKKKIKKDKRYDYESSSTEEDTKSKSDLHKKHKKLTKNKDSKKDTYSSRETEHGIGQKDCIENDNKSSKNEDERLSDPERKNHKKEKYNKKRGENRHDESSSKTQEDKSDDAKNESNDESDDKHRLKKKKVKRNESDSESSYKKRDDGYRDKHREYRDEDRDRRRDREYRDRYLHRQHRNVSRYQPRYWDSHREDYGSYRYSNKGYNRDRSRSKNRDMNEERDGDKENHENTVRYWNTGDKYKDLTDLNVKEKKSPERNLENEKEENDPEVIPRKQRKTVDLLTSKTGGAYIPPAKLRMMQAEISDKSGAAYQRIAWEALKKSIHGYINKVNTSNIGPITRELLKENVVRGRGLLARSIIQAQAVSPTFTPVYAALVSVINSKFPNIGELLLKRLAVQFKRGFKRNDKTICISSATFIAHLVNQGVAHEILILEILTLLVQTPTDDSIEVAIAILKEVGMKLTQICRKGIEAIFEMLRNILHEGQLDKRVQYMIEVIFQIRKDGFKDHEAVSNDLDLVEEEDQLTHLLNLDEATDGQDVLNVFKFDAEYTSNEEKYKELCKEILNTDESGSDGENGSNQEDGSTDDEEDGRDETSESGGVIVDNTETNLVALRRTIYLTIHSSLDYEECAHKLLKMQLKPGQEIELCHMFLDCCAEMRTYEKFFGLLAGRFCAINKSYISPFEEIFKDSYNTIHRLDANRLRNVAKFFAHLLMTDSISWAVLANIKLNEDDTTSSSRVFIKILFQELSEYMGLPKLNVKLKDEDLQEAFGGLFPKDDPKNTRFAINFFTTIGLGGLTDDLREHLKNRPKPVPEPVVETKPEEPTSESSSSTSDSSSSSSDSESSSDDDNRRKKEKDRKKRKITKSHHDKKKKSSKDKQIKTKRDRSREKRSEKSTRRYEERKESRKKR